MPPPDRKLLEDKEIQILEERGQTLLLDGSALVSGQVERVTSFEKGFPFQQASRNGKWEPDRGYLRENYPSDHRRAGKHSA
jgi:7,8-dihydropterin-6-yl-methyl-4-(beta-D-ribofuranosyl)aminobenzene 5'-phosphate synthase